MRPGFFRLALGRFESVILEVFEGHELQGRHVCGLEDDRRGDAGRESFLPPDRTQAPLIAGIQSGKIILGDWCAEVVARALGELEELFGHPDADNVHSEVARHGLAASAASETGDGVFAAGLERAAEDVFAARGF
jgi:hypothetical protein